MTKNYMYTVLCVCEMSALFQCRACLVMFLSAQTVTSASPTCRQDLLLRVSCFSMSWTPSQNPVGAVLEMAVGEVSLMFGRAAFPLWCAFCSLLVCVSVYLGRRELGCWLTNHTLTVAIFLLDTVSYSVLWLCSHRLARSIWDLIRGCFYSCLIDRVAAIGQFLLRDEQVGAGLGWEPLQMKPVWCPRTGGSRQTGSPVGRCNHPLIRLLQTFLCHRIS